MIYSSSSIWRQAHQRSRTIVTIGNFDGCHLGHQALVAHVIQQARADGVEAVVLTFTPHPEVFFGRLPPEQLIFGTQQKLQFIDALGVDAVISEPFDNNLAVMEPQRFVKDIVVQGLGATCVIVGENFRFGRKREGDVALLRRALEDAGARLEIFGIKDSGDAAVSSSRIRRLLGDGRVGEAARLLGRRHFCLGVIESGDQLGRKLGFATANLARIVGMVPADGVYAGWGRIGGEEVWQPAVCSIGMRPTVNGKNHRVEVHIIEKSYPDLYERELEFHFAERLRDEQKFVSLETLRAKIGEDIEVAKSILLTSRNY